MVQLVTFLLNLLWRNWGRWRWSLLFSKRWGNTWKRLRGPCEFYISKVRNWCLLYFLSFFLSLDILGQHFHIVQWRFGVLGICIDIKRCGFLRFRFFLDFHLLSLVQYFWFLLLLMLNLSRLFEKIYLLTIVCECRLIFWLLLLFLRWWCILLCWYILGILSIGILMLLILF